MVLKPMLYLLVLHKILIQLEHPKENRKVSNTQIRDPTKILTLNRGPRMTLTTH
jgi:hypothetical protein